MQAASYAEAAPGRTLGAVRYMAAQHESERGFDFGGEISRIPFLLPWPPLWGADTINVSPHFGCLPLSQCFASCVGARV